MSQNLMEQNRELRSRNAQICLPNLAALQWGVSGGAMNVSQKMLQQLSITDKKASTEILHFLYMLTQQKAGIDFLKCKIEKKKLEKCLQV